MAEEINQSDTPLAPIGIIADEPEVQFDQIDWLSFAVTFIVTLVVYLFTLSPDLTLNDAGEFSTGAFYGSFINPPGYPAWTLYSWLFIKLIPISTVAWRVSMGSAVAAALASGIVALMVSRGGKLLAEESTGVESEIIQKRQWLCAGCGYVAGMALGLSGIIWHKAVVADIYTFSLLLFTTILCLMLRWLMQPQKKRFLYGAFLIFGLLLTSSQELIVVLPGLVFAVLLGDGNLGRDLALTLLPLAAIIMNSWNQFSVHISSNNCNLPTLLMFGIVLVLAFIMVFVTRRFGSTWKFTLLCTVSFFAGLSFYFYLPIAAMTNPPMNWGYPRTADGFFHVLSRSQYEKWLPTGNLHAYANQLWIFVKITGKELGWPCLFLATIPFFKILRMNRRLLKWLCALVFLFICVGPGLVAELNYSLDAAALSLTKFYFMASFVPLSIFAGLGLVLCVRPTAMPMPTRS